MARLTPLVVMWPSVITNLLWYIGSVLDMVDAHPEMMEAIEWRWQAEEEGRWVPVWKELCRL